MHCVLIFRHRMAPEVALAAIMKVEHPADVYLYPFESVDKIPEKDLSKFPDNAKILVLGTYFDNATIEALKTKGKITVFCYSDEERGRYGAGADIAYTTELFDEHQKKTYPWVERLLRRMNKGTDEDDYFVRGVLQERKTNEIERGDMLDAFTRVVTGEFTEENAIMNGKMAVKIFKAMATSIVATSAAPMIFHGFRTRFVCSATEPVMDVAKAAAEGYDMGVVMRYNVKEGTTGMTFFTKDPLTVDLSFVNEPPYNGGGPDHCKGRTFRGMHIAPPKKNGEGVWEFFIPCREISPDDS